MAKMSDESKAKVKQAARHPVTWWKGAELPEESIRPWENGIQFLAEALKGFMWAYFSVRWLCWCACICSRCLRTSMR